MASIDLTAPGRAMESVAQGIKDLGKGVASGINAYANDQDEAADARAKSGYLTDKVKLDEQMKNETDAEALKAYPQRYQELADRWGGTLSGRKAETWKLTMAPKVAADTVSANDRLFAVQKDQDTAVYNDHLEQLRQIGVDPQSTQADREMALETGSDIVREMQQKGYLTETQAQGRRQKWVRDYTIDTYRSMPAEERLAALGQGATAADVAKAYEGVTESGHADVLMELFRKSGGQVIDPRETAWCAAFTDAILGASGKARRGSLRAADFLSYGTATDAPSKGDVVVFKPQAAGSSGHVGFVVSVDKDTVTYIAGNDANKVQVATLPVSEVAGFRVPPEAGKSALPPGADPDISKKVAERAMEAGKSNRASKLADFLAPDDQKMLANEAWAETRKAQADLDRQRKEAASGVSAQIAQDLQSMEKTGVGLEGLTPQQVVQAVGPQRAAEWETQRNLAKQYHETFAGSDVAPQAELNQRIDALRPKGGEPDFIERNKVYEKARKQANAITEERETDPAAAADRHSVVKVVRDAAEYATGDGGSKTMTPNSAQSIVAARLEAQRQLGILNEMPITRAEGAVIARQLRMIGDENVQGLQRFMKQMSATYGDYAPMVLQSALIHEKVNRDLSSAATEVMQAIKVGAAPKVSTAQAVVAATDNQQITDAMSGRAKPRPDYGMEVARTMRDQNAALAAQDADYAKQAQEQAANAPPRVTYDPQDLRALWEGRNNPDVIFQFNAKYGATGKDPAGAALKDLSRRFGAKPQDRR